MSTRDTPRRPISYIEGGRAQEQYLREEGDLGSQPLDSGVSRLQEAGGHQEQPQETWTQWKPRPKDPSSQRATALNTGLPCPLMKGLVWQQGTGLFSRWRERFLVLTKVLDHHSLKYYPSLSSLNGERTMESHHHSLI